MFYLNIQVLTKVWISTIQREKIEAVRGLSKSDMIARLQRKLFQNTPYLTRWHGQNNLQTNSCLFLHICFSFMTQEWPFHFFIRACAGAHTHKECMSRSQPRCTNCGAEHAASYGGRAKKESATLTRTMEPPPNPDVIFTCTNQKQRDTASKMSFASVVRENQQRSSSAKSQSKPSRIQPQAHNNKCPQRCSRTGRTKKSC